MEDPGRSGPHTAPELQCVVGGVSMEGLCKHKLVRSPELRLYIGRILLEESLCLRTHKLI